MRKIIITLLFAFYITGCSKKVSENLNSPDHKLSVKTEISDEETDAINRLCVILVFENKEGKEKRIQTGASDLMKWAIDWHDNDTLVLYSSDIGIYSYDIEGFEISQRNPNDDEQKTGNEAYLKKYDELPNS